MERRKNLCAMIPEELHNRVRSEQEELALTLSQYVEKILKEHFEKGEKAMEKGTRTLAFQVSEELFGRIKAHLAKTKMSQKNFVVGLIEQALAEAENREDASPVDTGKAEDGQAEGNQTGETLMETTQPDDRNEKA